VNTPAFQDAVVTKTTQNVTQNIANLLSGLSGTIVFVHENGQCPAGYSDHNTFLLPRYKAAYNTDKFQTRKTRRDRLTTTQIGL
jgi:hypothetical protein